MPRTARASLGNTVYHVMNRGNARQTVFHTPGDYYAFLKLLNDATLRIPMRIIGYCLMPNHFHLLLWPRHDGDLSRFMQWLLTAHVRRYHAHRSTPGNLSTGHIWQGRFKAFPIQDGQHLQILRYIERNPLRAGLERTPGQYPYTSFASRANPTTANPLSPDTAPFISSGPVALPPLPAWRKRLAQPESLAELTAIRHSLTRGTPFGSPQYQHSAAKKMDLQHTLRPRGRPRKLPQ